MRVYQATGDLLLTQAALGHASIQSTAVYARADRERLRGVLEAKAEVGSSPE
jgi:site-specific recombinase XerD